MILARAFANGREHRRQAQGRPRSALVWPRLQLATLAATFACSGRHQQSLTFSPAPRSSPRSQAQASQTRGCVRTIRGSSKCVWAVWSCLPLALAAPPPSRVKCPDRSTPCPRCVPGVTALPHLAHLARPFPPRTQRTRLLLGEAPRAHARLCFAISRRTTLRANRHSDGAIPHRCFPRARLSRARLSRTRLLAVAPRMHVGLFSAHVGGRSGGSALPHRLRQRTHLPANASLMHACPFFARFDRHAGRAYSRAGVVARRHLFRLN